MTRPNTRWKSAKERDATYAAPLRVRASLFKQGDWRGERAGYLHGRFPLMTESGTFVINGAERVIVSQLVRSPGVYYGMSYDKTGKKLFTSTVIPNRERGLNMKPTPTIFSMSVSIKTVKFQSRPLSALC